MCVVGGGDAVISVDYHGDRGVALCCDCGLGLGGVCHLKRAETGRLGKQGSSWKGLEF